MQIRKFFKKTALNIALVVIAISATSAISNQIFNRYNKRQQDDCSFGMPMGLFSSIHGYKYKSTYDNKNYKGCVFVRAPLIYRISYIDNEEKSPLDTKVDAIRIATLFGVRFLHRDTDYGTHKPEFDRADRILAREEARYSNFFETGL